MAVMFATVQDLENILGGSDIPNEVATIAIQLASADVQGELDQDIVQVEDDEITLDSDDRLELLLPQLPVTSIDSVEIEDEVLEPEDYELTDYGTLRRTDGGSWGCQPVTIVLTRGYPDGEIPDQIRSVTLSLAARKIGNPGGVKSETYESYGVTYPDAPLVEPELRRLDRYRAATGIG